MSTPQRPGRRAARGPGLVQNRVQKGVPTGGQFATGAHAESGISLSAGQDAGRDMGQNVEQAPAGAPFLRRPTSGQATQPTLGRGQRAWAALNRVMSFGTSRTTPTTRADRADLASRSAAAAGTAAMAGGVAAGAPVVAAGAGVVLAVGAVGVLAASVAQSRGSRAAAARA